MDLMSLLDSPEPRFQGSSDSDGSLERIGRETSSMLSLRASSNTVQPSELVFSATPVSASNEHSATPNGK